MLLMYSEGLSSLQCVCMWRMYVWTADENSSFQLEVFVKHFFLIVKVIAGGNFGDILRPDH